MIITKQKDLNKILERLKGKGKVFIVGCEACATKCATGGQEQVDAFAELLKQQGKDVVGSAVLDTPCDMRIVRRDLAQNEKVLQADGIVLLTCGAGIQAISQVIENKFLIPVLDTLFLGTIERLGNFNQYCSLCGECILEETGGICPATRCAKGLLNGPCGGSVNGKCEANSDNDCAWVLICRKSNGNSSQFRKYRELKNNSSQSSPQKVKSR